MNNHQENVVVGLPLLDRHHPEVHSHQEAHTQQEMYTPHENRQRPKGHFYDSSKTHPLFAAGFPMPGQLFSVNEPVK